jgi:DNA-binding MarR family transcriptional regulator
MSSPAPIVDAVRAIARMSRLLEGAAEGLSLADYRVLSAIDEGEGRASRLAARLTLGKPTVSASVDSLVRRGMVLRSTVLGDNRAIGLSLTAIGKARFDAVESRMAGELAMLCDGAPNGDAIVDSLAALGAAIERAMADRAAQAAFQKPGVQKAAVQG